MTKRQAIRYLSRRVLAEDWWRGLAGSKPPVPAATFYVAKEEGEDIAKALGYGQVLYNARGNNNWELKFYDDFDQLILDICDEMSTWNLPHARRRASELMLALSTCGKD